MVLGINPGRGKNYSARDKPLLDAVRTLSKGPSRESFKLPMAEYREHLPKWGIYSDIGFPQRFNLKLSQIMVSNVLPASTEIRGSSPSLEPLYKFAISKFITRQLKLLRPHAVLLVGSRANDMMHRYWPDWSSGVEMMHIWHPTYGLYPRKIDAYEEQLDKVTDRIDSLRGKVRKRN